VDFARRVFTTSGVYGLLIMTPQFFLEPRTSTPELYYGFVGAVFAWQLTSLIIARDPARYRPIMLPSGLGKLIFSVAVLGLWTAGRVPAYLLTFVAIDLAFAVLFLKSWRRTGAVKEACHAG
jgi:hypothetical protein